MTLFAAVATEAHRLAHSGRAGLYFCARFFRLALVWCEKAFRLELLLVSRNCSAQYAILQYSIGNMGSHDSAWGRSRATAE